MFDVQKFVGEVQDYIGRAIAPVVARLKALEDRPSERGIDGKDGRDGSDGASITAADVEPLIAERVKAAIAQVPAPQNGRDGKDAEPILLQDVIAELADASEIKTLLSLLVAEAIHEGVTTALPDAVAAYLKANPPKDGRDGADGKDGRDAEPGEDGAKGDPGRDGIGVAGTLIDRDGALVLTLSDGTTKSLGVVVGRNGTDGRDGLSMTDVSRQYDAESREIVERWTAAGVTKELRYPAGGIHHGGYWREGVRAKAAETWTRGGTTFIAKCDTDATPSRESEHWLIFASKGRDGQDGRNGRDLGPPAPVKLGSSND